MIIQALVQRYEDAGGLKTGWQYRAVDFAINLDLDGNIIHIPDIRRREGKKKIRQQLLLPMEPAGRTSGIEAAFLCDNDGYLLGNDGKRGDQKFRAAAALHCTVLEQVDSEAARAMKLFFAAKPPEAAMPRANEKDTGANCVFMINGKYAHECPEICDAWDAYFGCQNAAGETILDLVSGNPGVIARLHGPISLPGVSMGRVPLVSMNAESFASYGKTAKDPAAQISKETANKYVEALNALLKSATHHKSFAKDTLVYWAEQGGEAEAETFSWAMEPQESDSEKLTALIHAISNGTISKEIDIDRKFHILCLSPNAGRISIRFYHRDHFGSTLKKIADHYENLRIYAAPGKTPEKFSYFPPWLLLAETTVKKSAGEATPLLAGQLLNSIVSGARYPLALYHAILNRIRAGEAVNKAKAAMIKAVLKRNYESEVALMALNKDSTNIPYTLGRLFSVLEEAQANAGNTGLRERYFSSACANPRNVFPNLLKLSIHHANKSAYGIKYERQKTELISKLDSETPFPTTLSNQEQGEFIVGYYHQQQVRFTKKEQNNQEGPIHE